MRGGRHHSFAVDDEDANNAAYVPSEEEQEDEDDFDEEDVSPKKRNSQGVVRERAKARTTSRYRGVTHHCRTRRWESHIWENSKQLYLGGFNSEHQAALAYDIAACKFRGPEAVTNFNIRNYDVHLSELAQVTKAQLVQSLRQQSKGFQRASSQFRGVTRHQKGKWEARIGQATGKKYKYLGLYVTEIEAAIAYDTEAVAQKGILAVTNFALSGYQHLMSPSQIAEAQERGLLSDGEDGCQPDEPSAQLSPDLMCTFATPPEQDGGGTFASHLKQGEAATGSDKHAGVMRNLSTPRSLLGLLRLDSDAAGASAANSPACCSTPQQLRSAAAALGPPPAEEEPDLSDLLWDSNDLLSLSDLLDDGDAAWPPAEGLPFLPFEQHDEERREDGPLAEFAAMSTLRRNASRELPADFKLDGALL